MSAHSLGWVSCDKGADARREQRALDIPLRDIARTPTRRPEKDFFDPRLKGVFGSLGGQGSPSYQVPTPRVPYALRHSPRRNEQFRLAR